MKKVLILGANGMLGSMVVKVLSESDFEVISTGREEFDISQLELIDSKLRELKPEVIINCAAYTNVNLAETEQDQANLVNNLTVGELAKSCAELKIKFVQIITDYVFGDNNPGGHSEYDLTSENQLNFYGKTKYLGEVNALRNNPDSYIVRTSWVFGPNGNNFVDTMVRLSKEKDELNIVSDEFGSPTFTKDIANHIKYILENELPAGIYHSINEGTCSRFDEAQKVFEILKSNTKLNKIKLADYPRPAKIANYSILKNTKLAKLQSWDKAVEEYLKNYSK